MKDLKTLIKDVERDLVINLTISQRHKRINAKIARDVAREYMEGYPYKSKKDLFKYLYEMSEKYKEARKVYIKHVSAYEDEERENILKIMRGYMKDDDFINAIRVAKGGE